MATSENDIKAASQNARVKSNANQDGSVCVTLYERFVVV